LHPAGAQQGKLPFSTPRNYQALPESAMVETTKGKFIIEFYREQAPVTVRNFEYLGKKRFYENLTFHRYIPNFVLQGGDPKGNGKGGPGYSLPPEFSEINHAEGTLGMAMLPAKVNPERLSNGSQFYITLADSPHLDGLYTVFGKVVEGMDVVSRLRAGDRILHVYFPK
jgi:peptidyl-prolyl cis-trans isomerase B (cyclophilin B)